MTRAADSLLHPLHRGDGAEKGVRAMGDVAYLLILGAVQVALFAALRGLDRL
ncbi:hypothetical protein [Actinoalloteichus caeruleus]|uniref:Uncharacterized protein n=1 Tax=Actinoalloteichus caeruleus DSM 43889 TaxID=1120930 RepID=A0ABT1JHP3_ACTCY|nr:hypothetical protein [Actinoalloteichus caeruleus]MCP2332022.1 hypothetical protein [Actinoalloteichus caeruleus DSM 43889]